MAIVFLFLTLTCSASKAATNDDQNLPSYQGNRRHRHTRGHDDKCVDRLSRFVLGHPEVHRIDTTERRHLKRDGKKIPNKNACQCQSVRSHACVYFWSSHEIFSDVRKHLRTLTKTQPRKVNNDRETMNKINQFLWRRRGLESYCLQQTNVWYIPWLIDWLIDLRQPTRHHWSSHLTWPLSFLNRASSWI